MTRIRNLSKLWKARNLSLKGKIIVFKSLVLPEITHLPLTKIILNSIMDQLNKKEKNFIWNGFNPKIKNSTIKNYCKNSGLKNVDIAPKISSLQRTLDEKIIWWNFSWLENTPLWTINESLGKKFVFLSNSQVNKKLTEIFLQLYG